MRYRDSTRTIGDHTWEQRASLGPPTGVRRSVTINDQSYVVVASISWRMERFHRYDVVPSVETREQFSLVGVQERNVFQHRG